MSVLVVVGGSEVDEPIVRRLLAQGDNVRVLESTPVRRDLWRALGAHVAVGDPTDADLVERAAQNARTIVVVAPQATQDILRAVTAAAAPAGVDRVVVSAPSLEEHLVEVVRASSVSYVFIVSGRPGMWRRRRVASERLAEAVDAADDLAGDPHLEVDLTSGSGIAELGLPPSSGSRP